MSTSRNLITYHQESSEVLEEEFDPELELELLKFIDTELSANRYEILERIKKLIFLAKACLESPEILLIDQKALDLKISTFRETFQTVRRLLPSATILIIMNTYEDILLTEKTYVMEQGRVVEEGTCKQLILDRASKLSSIMIKSDKKDWEQLYEECGGNERDKRLALKQQ